MILKTVFVIIGKILVDEKLVEDYKISEKEFMVLMVSKPKAAAKAPEPVAAASVPEPVAPAPVPEPAAAAPVPEPVPAASPAPVTSEPTTEDSQLGKRRDALPKYSTDVKKIIVTGSKLDGVIQNMMEMGFEREQCVRALRASFNNPDRAVEYLFNVCRKYTCNNKSKRNI